MSILIPGMEMPKSCTTEACFVRTVSYEDGTVWCPVAKGYLGDQATVCPLVPVPEFSDISSDSDDVWKKIFSLVVLLLSDREKFDKIKDDVLADLEMMDSAKPNYCSHCVHWWRNKELPCPWDYMFNDDEYYYDCMDFERYEEVQNND